LTFVALDYESTDEVTAFANEYIKAPVVLGNVTVQQAWSISAFPSYAIINPDNKISHRSVGYSTSVGMAFWVLLTKIGLL
jgi:hypothetical protein